MSFRMISVASLALALLLGAAALAAQAAEPNTHEGKVVSITGEKLVMTGKDGKEHSHALTTDAKLTLDGKACKAADLKAGTRIRVTTQGEGNSVANRSKGSTRMRILRAAARTAKSSASPATSWW